MIRTRFAPSPTGSLHIGGLRSAIYPYALAKKNNGEFFLRIEDTDQKRTVSGATEKLQDILKIFGLSWDDCIIQSERVKANTYLPFAQKLLESGNAFYCQCFAKNAKTDGFSSELRDPCREKGFTSGAIKIKIPEGEKISFTDYVLNKKIEWPSNSVADATLLKSDGFPTYHLASVVDDHLMKISHVLRGHDWQPSTPIHLYVYKYLGLTPPEIGHLTDILDPEGGKLSKRKGSVSCEGLLAEGYLPEALLNFVILLGWAPKDNRENYTLSEFVKNFDSHGFQKSNPVFTTQKLNWFNGQYIRKISNEKLLQLIKPFTKYKNIDENIVQLIKDRLEKLSDIDALVTPIFKTPDFDNLLWPDPKKSLDHLTLASELLSKCDWEKTVIDSLLISEIKSREIKTGDFFMSLRIAIFGTKFTPPINDVIILIGREETLKRLSNSINYLGSLI